MTTRGGAPVLSSATAPRAASTPLIELLSSHVTATAHDVDVGMAEDVGTDQHINRVTREMTLYELMQASGQQSAR